MFYLFPHHRPRASNGDTKHNFVPKASLPPMADGCPCCGAHFAAAASQAPASLPRSQWCFMCKRTVCMECRAELNIRGVDRISTPTWICKQCDSRDSTFCQSCHREEVLGCVVLCHVCGNTCCDVCARWFPVGVSRVAAFCQGCRSQLG